LPVGLSSYGMVPFEGYLYVFGGWDGNQVVDSVYQYDPESDHWQELTPMPTARSDLGVSVVEDKIFAIGGFDGEKPLATTEVYTPSLEESDTSPWEIDQPLPDSIYAMGVVSLADRIYIFGGESNAEETIGFLEYASEAGNWAQFGESITADWSHLGAVPVGTYIYLIGGELDGSITSNNLAYQALYTIAIPIVR
jgi:N-acetylneuraminic acid mutarotase